MFFFLSDRFVPFVFMALGHRKAPLGPPKYKKLCDAETLPLWEEFAFFNWLLVSVAAPSEACTGFCGNVHLWCSGCFSCGLGR